MNRLEERVADQLNEKAWAMATYRFDLASPNPYAINADKCGRAIRAAISAYLSALEAQGLKIVPVEPTEAMLYEADERMRKWIPMPTYRGEYTSVLKDAYAAMLNASQD